MKTTFKRLLPLLLSLLMLLSLSGCGLELVLDLTNPAQTAPEIRVSPGNTAAPDDTVSPGDIPLPDDTPLPEATAAPESAAAPKEDAPSTVPAEDGYFYDPENVVLYLSAYGRLPDNYITKKEARALGWEGGTPEAFLPDAAIGGDSFGNREGLLPQAKGRSYQECDLNTNGASSRGAERLVFSNDGLYFYTNDHYAHFTELTVTPEGLVQWAQD